MTALDHKVCKPGRTYELRKETSNNTTTIVSGDDYWDVRHEGMKLQKSLKKGESLVLVTADGYEVCRWM